MKWETSILTTDGGAQVQAVEPVIVSASRATDIPAFWADWFFGRLRAGYSVWVNPFDRKRSYVSYARTRLIVFWSKNPAPLLAHLPELEQRGIHCYIQFTLNDYECEGLEPGVPPLTQRIDTARMNEPAFRMVLTATGQYAYRRPEDGIYVVPIGCLGA